MGVVGRGEVLYAAPVILDATIKCLCGCEAVAWPSAVAAACAAARAMDGGEPRGPSYRAVTEEILSEVGTPRG